MTEAIRIPCHRPSLRIRRRCKRIEQDGLRTREVTWSSHTRGYYESDSKITEKMVIACYNYHGNWKRHIPFYGIIDVREVQFAFTFITDDPDRPDRFEVLVQPLNYKDIEQDCNRIIASGPDEITCFNEGPCLNGDHTTSCPRHDAYDTLWERCIGDKLAEARRIKKSLPLLHLLRECALNPAKADCASIRTLSGMALAKGPILQNRTIDDFIGKVKTRDLEDELLPAREIVLGWQTDRIFDEAPKNIVMTWFILASIWVVVVAGGLAGDWNLWVAVGQLLIATLATFLFRLK